MRRLLVIGAVCSGLLSAAGCGSDLAPTQPSTDSTTLYWALALDQRAVTLALTAPYDTLTITATPRSAAGAPLADLGAATLTSGDLTCLRVSPEGVLQALAPCTGVAVVATLRAGNVTHVDTALVDVMAEPPAQVLASLSIHPAPPDSAKLGFNPSFPLPRPLVVRALDANGDTIAAPRIDFRSLDPSIASVDRQYGFVVGNRPGQVLIVASATAYGVTRADTLPFTIGLPTIYQVHIVRGAVTGTASLTSFSPSEVTVGTGATITWIWQADLPATDVTFEDPSSATEDDVLVGYGVPTGSGNISAPDRCTNQEFSVENCLRSRRFPLPGVYRYRSELTGAVGRIVVVDESVATTP